MIPRDEAARIVATYDSPEGRFKLREKFYEAAHLSSYGRSELSFLQWEIERGVLDPSKGSPWWRAVNLSLCIDAQEALLALDVPDPQASSGAKRWLAFLEDPNPASWYCAHNGSIAQGYLQQIQLARKETPGEQSFLNIVLYRVLFAGAMASGELAFGGLLASLLEHITPIAADPKLPAVEVLVHLADFYPRNYPLQPEDVKAMLGRTRDAESALVRLLDDELILPHAPRLYRWAAEHLALPLTTFVRHDLPVYPP
jgi:hypothetical protein